MVGSKPEELVAKLYEEGMTDDGVRAQLADFGLSGREIHLLIKKAKVVKPSKKDSALEKAEVEEEKKEQPKQAALAEEKKPLFSGMFGMKKEKPTKGEATVDEKLEKLNKMITGAAPKASETGEKKEETPPEEPKKEKKSLFSGLFGKKKGELTKEPAGTCPLVEGKKEEAPQPETKKKNKKEKADRDRDASYQAKMKRLSLIKEQIYKPTSWEAGELPPGEPAKAQAPEPKKTEALKTIDEDTMDEKTAKGLVEGIGRMENEMGEIKQLLDTLRELNIKLVEILEKK